ncbi:hypothetical protein AC579_2123 [Pseudocercospora musae]|uniref:Uncharacterized protein n=1 Tax=Pseudocercospora musae TaxID=113226 RepID=A0A139I4Z3_9PEZI|nr:hypothetical protein AC579_2123 [Pseudocercospora musae]
MPQVSPATGNREETRASEPAQHTSQTRRRRQSQCPSDDSAYGPGVGEDDANVHTAQFRRADGTTRSVRQPGSGVSDRNDHSNVAGHFPKPCAYWSDGVDGDTRAAMMADLSPDVRFKNYTSEHMASRREPRQKPEQAAGAQKARQIVAAHEQEIRRLMEVAGDLEYRLRLVERQDQSR